MQRCFSFRASAHVADVHIDLAVIAGDAGRAGALPHLAGDGAAGHVIMGVPDGVLAQLAQIQPVAEPQGGGVHARLVAQRLGVDVEFVIIEWGQKVNELNSKAIDVVWNGMTLTDGVQTAMTCTPAYCRNAQVIVVPAA